MTCSPTLGDAFSSRSRTSRGLDQRATGPQPEESVTARGQNRSRNDAEEHQEHLAEPGLAGDEQRRQNRDEERQEQCFSLGEGEPSIPEQKRDAENRDAQEPEDPVGDPEDSRHMARAPQMSEIGVELFDAPHRLEVPQRTDEGPTGVPIEEEDVRRDVDGAGEAEGEHCRPADGSLPPELPEQEKDERTADHEQRVGLRADAANKERAEEGPFRRPRARRRFSVSEEIAQDQSRWEEEDEAEQERVARDQPVEEQVAEEKTTHFRPGRSVELAEKDDDEQRDEACGRAAADASSRQDQLQRKEHEQRHFVQAHDDHREIDPGHLADRRQVHEREEVVVELLAGDHRQRHRPVVQRLGRQRDHEDGVFLIRHAGGIARERRLCEADGTGVQEQERAENRSDPDRFDRQSVCDFVYR